VPGCPDWHTKSDSNPGNSTSSGYGCATNGNLAAMIANPEHLVHGASAPSTTTIMGSTKAIETYRNAAPTGAGGLKQVSSQGK
jgi:pilus assembly protein CpaD